ncbi:ShlB/FhaC/HecB family hemolysin secretion/activation protein [Caulobacter sp. KR2-114]|uniref:ShlB/FhaC/HecB family hemolysin secretion/activation protein n=1 Tax=Caulobacter sp. KR2-114 TaxID=3400912 RepID=UPI003C10470C
MKAIGASLAFGPIFAAVIPAVALAQGATPPLSSTVDPTAALPKVESPSAPLQPPVIDRTTVPPSAQDLRPQFTLEAVRFDEATALPAAALEPAWAAYRGKPVTLADLRKIARKAEALYAAAGYPFVAVVVTPQAVDAGVVHMRVVEGRVSNLTVLAKDPVARRQASAAFAPLIDVKPLSLPAIEGAYQRARDIPGLALAGALRRGTVPGGMDLVVQAKREEWRVYANVNNLYPDANGPWGALVGVDHFGGSEFGDQTSLQAYTSLDGGRQEVVRLTHQQRLNASGTTLTLMGLGAWANPKGAVAPLDIATNVATGRFAISQPFVERTSLSVVGEAAFEIDDQKTKLFKTIGISDDELRVLSASLRAEWRPRQGGQLSGSVELRKGLDILGASHSGDTNLSRLGADPQAFVAKFKLEGETPTVQRLRLYGRLEGQDSDHPLTAPEQYAVGNLSIGRGYEPGAAFGDKAIAGVAEVRFGPFPVASRFRLEPFVFYDAARLWTLTPGAHTTIDVASYGGGLRIDMPGRGRLEMTYAVPHEPPLGHGQPVPGSRFMVNLTVGLTDAVSMLTRSVSKGGGR